MKYDEKKKPQRNKKSSKNYKYNSNFYLKFNQNSHVNSQWHDENHISSNDKTLKAELEKRENRTIRV